MYDRFSQVYDLLVEIEYQELIDIIKENIKEGSKVLDLACGTGTIMEILNNEGYEMMGSDLSEQMLEIARSKNPNSKLFVHDLKEDFYTEADSIICTVDSVNYLLKLEEVDNLFKNISNNINEGTFIFDCHSENKLKTLNDYLHVDLSLDLSYVWKVDVIDDYLNHYLTFFTQNNGLYERFDEEHIQRVYSKEDIERLLTKNNFEFKCKNLEDRIVYICNKK